MIRNLTDQELEILKKNAYKDGFSDGAKTSKRTDINYNKAIMVESIRHYGINNQLTVAIEEMAELTQVLSKYKRGECIDREHLIEEFGDAIYMLEQVRYIFYIENKEVEQSIWKKQCRQAERMITERKKVSADGK